MSVPRLSILLPLLAVCVALRVQAYRASADPAIGWYLWNFSPLMALTLFSGACFRGWGWRLAPVLAYLAGDAAVWIVGSDIADAFRPDSLFVYLGWLAVLGCGWLARERSKSWLAVGAASLGGAAAFFLVTNFGSWLMDPFAPQPTGYDRSLLGLWESYVAALPFCRNDLLALLTFSGLFFSPIGRSWLTRAAAAPAAESAPGWEPVGEATVDIV